MLVLTMLLALGGLSNALPMLRRLSLEESQKAKPDGPRWLPIQQVDPASLPQNDILLPESLWEAAELAFGANPPESAMMLLRNGFIPAPILVELFSSHPDGLPADVLDWSFEISDWFRDAHAAAFPADEEEEGNFDAYGDPEDLPPPMLTLEGDDAPPPPPMPDFPEEGSEAEIPSYGEWAAELDADASAPAPPVLSSEELDADEPATEALSEADSEEKSTSSEGKSRRKADTSSGESAEAAASGEANTAEEELVDQLSELMQEDADEEPKDELLEEVLRILDFFKF